MKRRVVLSDQDLGDAIVDYIGRSTYTAVVFFPYVGRFDFVLPSRRIVVEYIRRETLPNEEGSEQLTHSQLIMPDEIVHRLSREEVVEAIEQSIVWTDVGNMHRVGSTDPNIPDKIEVRLSFIARGTRREDVHPHVFSATR